MMFEQVGSKQSAVSIQPVNGIGATQVSSGPEGQEGFPQKHSRGRPPLQIAQNRRALGTPAVPDRGKNKVFHRMSLSPLIATRNK